MTTHALIKDCYPVKKGDTVLIHAAAGGMVLSTSHKTLAQTTCPHPLSHKTLAGTPIVPGHQSAWSDSDWDNLF